MNRKQRFFLMLLTAFISITAKGQFYTIMAKEQHTQEEKPEAENKGEEKTLTMPSEFPESETNAQVFQKLSARRFLSLPLDTLIVTSKFGFRTDPFTGKHKFHKGIDLVADYHYIYSIMPGKVIKTGQNKTLGNFVQIDHGDFITTCGHLYIILVSEKEALEAGKVIGVSGSTGRSTGEHLHFQISYKKQIIDPLPILTHIQELSDFCRQEMVSQ